MNDPSFSSQRKYLYILKFTNIHQKELRIYLPMSYMLSMIGRKYLKMDTKKLASLTENLKVVRAYPVRYNR